MLFFLNHALDKTDKKSKSIFAPLEMNESYYHNEEVRFKMAEQYKMELDKIKDLASVLHIKSIISILPSILFAKR